jgi:FXSXX-COOH protein
MNTTPPPTGPDAQPLGWRAMAYSADLATDDAAADDDGTGHALPDVTALPTAALLACGDTALAHALRRIATDTLEMPPALAGFGNFAPDRPGPS